MDSLADNLIKLGIELEKMSVEEKKIVIEKANTNREALRKLYSVLKECIE